MAKYPTGVECHGGRLRIVFMYQGKRMRESIGALDTAKNRNMASELRSSVLYAIKTGSFNYAAQFPDSPYFRDQGESEAKITLDELSKKWLSLKKIEITENAMIRYQSYIKICNEMLGENRMISSLTHEDILALRRELLTGYQICGAHQINRSSKKGRTVRTVNVYLACFSGMMGFAEKSGYIPRSPFSGVAPLKKSRNEPDPLSRDEYNRLISFCPSEQISNLWKLAINTGMRHGEVCALAWEDIDLVNWTITVSRNIAIKGHFTPPKTESGNRVISLTSAAIEALKSQMAYTRMGARHKINVHMREFGRTRTDDCTFVFIPRLTARNGRGGDWYAPGSFGTTWNEILKRAGIRHRRAYESRHTYACWALSAGVNPSFIAAQMGHSSAQMVYSVYGKWMSDNDADQLSIMNRNFAEIAPHMPQAINQ